MRVLVLGGYGLIGREIVAQLLRHDIDVVGMARSADVGQRLLPEARWIGADIGRLTRIEDWSVFLEDVDAVINASGALQSGGRDNLAAVQRDAIHALIGACENSGVKTFVQISALGANALADTEFLRTKGEADVALRKSALSWVILKPGLVVSSTAYGGTSLLRTLAAVPYVQPMVLADARMQTVGVIDVARAAVRCLSDPTLARQDFDLVEQSPQTLREVVLSFRRWLGFCAPVRVVELPRWFGFSFARLADLSGVFGWRAPLRTTALQVLASDVVGDPEPWRVATGETMASLDETLAGIPSTLQERIFARMQLLFPVLVVMFAMFWIVSGLVGIWRHATAVAIVSPPLSAWLASAFVYAGSALDLLVGGGLMVRRAFKASCVLAIAVCVSYLIAGTFITPGLWADPLGPFVKIIPVVGLAMVLLVMAEER